MGEVQANVTSEAVSRELKRLGAPQTAVNAYQVGDETKPQEEWEVIAAYNIEELYALLPSTVSKGDQLYRLALSKYVRSGADERTVFGAAYRPMDDSVATFWTAPCLIKMESQSMVDVLGTLWAWVLKFQKKADAEAQSEYSGPRVVKSPADCQWCNHDGPTCTAENEGRVCSRPEGHKGEHVACYDDEHAVMLWINAEKAEAGAEPAPEAAPAFVDAGDGKIECPQCGGNGSIYLDGAIHSCGKCTGTGRVPPETLTE